MAVSDEREGVNRRPTSKRKRGTPNFLTTFLNCKNNWAFYFRPHDYWNGYNEDDPLCCCTACNGLEQSFILEGCGWGGRRAGVRAKQEPQEGNSARA